MSSASPDEVQAWLRSQTTPGMLSSLVFANDEASLGRFGQRVSRTSLSRQQLELLQRLATAICFAVASEHADDWKAIERAAEAVRRISPPIGEGGSRSAPYDAAAKQRQTPKAPAAIGPPPPPPTAPSPNDPRPVAAIAAPPAIRVGGFASTPPATEPQHITGPPAATQSTNIDATATLDAAMIEDAIRSGCAPLPFAGDAAPPPPLSAEAPAHVASGETTGIDADVIASIIATANAGTPRVTNPPLTLDQYAALVARIECGSGGDTTGLLHEFGLQDEHDRRALDTYFSGMFARDDQMRAKFAESLLRWKAWLATQGTAGPTE